MDDHKTEFVRIQERHRELISQLLVAERQALQRTERGAYELRQAELPAARILTPTTSRFRTALEAKIYDAYARWRGFWEDHGDVCRAAVSALPQRKVLVQREYSPRWIEPHLPLLFDTVCIPIDFHVLEMALDVGALTTIVEYLDMCNRMVLDETDHECPTIVFVPTWRADIDAAMTFQRQAEELAASVVARAVGANDMLYAGAADELAKAVRSSRADYAYLDELLLLNAEVPLLATEFFERANPGFYRRMVRRELTTADSRYIPGLLTSRFAMLFQRERLAKLFASSVAYDADTWPQFLHRNTYVANAWGVDHGVPGNLLTRVFALRFPWLQRLSMQDIGVLRRSPALAEFRRATAEYEQLFAGITAFDDFQKAAARYEHTVATRLSEDSQEVAREARESKRRRQTTALSFAATVAMGAASIVFPPLLPITLLTGAFSVIVGSASLRDLVRAHRAAQAAEPTSRGSAVSLFLPPPSADV